jgi:hypothetical protein
MFNVVLIYIVVIQDAILLCKYYLIQALFSFCLDTL